MSRIVNFGSVNIDHVYQVPYLARPGETLASTGYARGAGVLLVSLLSPKDSRVSELGFKPSRVVGQFRSVAPLRRQSR